MKRWAVFFFLAVAIACALRFPELDRRPMHNDEAVNAIKFGGLWERADYQYDPAEFHGPALHYLTAAVCRLTGAPGFKHLSEARLRLIAALAGIGLILFLPLVRNSLGRGAVAAAALFTAVSPAMVFYSRCWIHEELFVLFTFLAIATAWRFVKRPSWAGAVFAGLAFGLMQATKETFVFPVAAAAGALLLNWLWLSLAGPKPNRPRLPLEKVLLAVAMWLLVWATLFTSFFTHAAGLVDSYRTFWLWLGPASGDTLHVHAWPFYFERLFWFHSARGPFWTEGLLLVLAVVGACDGFRRLPRGGDADFIRFIAFYTVILAVIYSIIPYKTPWCALGFLHGLILLAGVGAAVLWQQCGSKISKFAVAGSLTLGVAHLGWQAWRAGFSLSSDRANPWVYAQTSPDLLNLVEQIQSVALAGPGDATVIKVIAAGGDYWPLPWYLRQFDHVGWYAETPSDSLASMVIASPELSLRLDAQGTHIMAGYFQLRPGIFLELYVERELWGEYLKK